MNEYNMSDGAHAILRITVYKEPVGLTPHGPIFALL